MSTVSYSVKRIIEGLRTFPNYGSIRPHRHANGTPEAGDGLHITRAEGDCPHIKSHPGCMTGKKQGCQLLDCQWKNSML